MAELLLPYAEARPDEPAVTDEWGTTTWAGLNARVDRLIGAMRAAGLRTGDVIAVHSGNRREYFEIMAAATHTGLRHVLVNWHWTAEELRYVLQDSGARALFSEAPFADVARVAAKDLGLWCKVALGGDIDGFAPYEDFLAAGPGGVPEDQVLGVPMVYTSGTTGRPKGVQRSTQVIGAEMERIRGINAGLAALMRIPEGGCGLLAGPVYHSSQQFYSFGMLLIGRPVVMRRRWDAAESLRLIDDHAVTHTHLVPTQFVRLLKLDEEVRTAFDGGSLAAVWHGAAPCPPQIKRRMIEWWGPIVHEYYGSTEASFNTVVMAEEWLRRPGTVGRPLPSSEVTILRPDGTPAAPGERGQIWLRYAGGDTVKYWRDEEKTKAIHREDGRFTTGDIGYFDEDGYLFLADRAIDMIISGGVNIYPAEIESALITHSAVRDVAVFGIPDEEFGEQVKAVVELVDGAVPSDGLAAELMEHCRAALARYKVPKSIDFTGELPRTPTGKLYKRLLRDPYWADREQRI